MMSKKVKTTFIKFFSFLGINRFPSQKTGLYAFFSYFLQLSFAPGKRLGAVSIMTI